MTCMETASHSSDKIAFDVKRTLVLKNINCFYLFNVNKSQRERSVLANTLYSLTITICYSN